MNKMFSLIGLVCLLFFGEAYSEGISSAKKSLDEMENKIESLEGLKKHCKKTITKHLILAQRWQSQGDLALESRREYALAEYQKDRLHILEIKIERLKKKVEELREVGKKDLTTLS
jgi:phage shock protein A